MGMTMVAVRQKNKKMPNTLPGLTPPNTLPGLTPSCGVIASSISLIPNFLSHSLIVPSSLFLFVIRFGLLLAS